MAKSRLLNKVKKAAEAPEWTAQWDLDKVESQLEFDEDAKEVRQNLYDVAMQLPAKTKTSLYKAWGKLEKEVQRAILKAYEKGKKYNFTGSKKPSLLTPRKK